MKNINNKEVKCLKDENVRKEFNIKEFSFNKLTKEIFDNIKKEDLTAVFYAEGGAMGYSGLTMIVINEMNVYYSGLIGEEDDLSQIEILKLFEGFKHIDGFFAPDMTNTNINGEQWTYYYLGVGNHLYIRHDLNAKIGNYIFDTNLEHRYGNFMNLVNAYEELA